MTAYEQSMELRSRLRQTLNQLKTEGVTVPKLIEAMRNELSLLHIEDDETSTDSLSGSGAGASQTTEQ